MLSLSSASSEPKGRALIVVANKPYTDSVRNNLKEAEKLIPTIDTQYSPAIVGSAQILNALDNDLAQLYPNDTTLTLHGAVDNAKGARERQIRSTSSAHRTTEDKS